MLLIIWSPAPTLCVQLTASQAGKRVGSRSNKWNKKKLQSPDFVCQEITDWSAVDQYQFNQIIIIVENFDAKIITKVVAGAHNIHSILPEDTIQKRKVADMWKVIEFFIWQRHVKGTTQGESNWN